MDLPFIVTEDHVHNVLEHLAEDLDVIEKDCAQDYEVRRK